MLLLLPANFALAEQVCQQDTILSTSATSRFQIHESGTVVDSKTGLMWRACVEGVVGDECEVGQAMVLSWAGALQYVSTLNAHDGFAGENNWRLPNIRELSTLVELQCAEPAINSEVFVNSPVSHVWTSSPYHFYTHYSWYVDFATGAATYDERIREKSLRLVRDL